MTSKGVMGNGGLRCLIEAARCFNVIEGNSANTCTHSSLSFLLKQREPKSLNDKPSQSISIVHLLEFCGITFVVTAVFCILGRLKLLKIKVSSLDFCLTILHAHCTNFVKNQLLLFFHSFNFSH